MEADRSRSPCDLLYPYHINNSTSNHEISEFLRKGSHREAAIKCSMQFSTFNYAVTRLMTGNSMERGETERQRQEVRVIFTIFKQVQAYLLLY